MSQLLWFLGLGSGTGDFIMSQSVLTEIDQAVCVPVPNLLFKVTAHSLESRKGWFWCFLPQKDLDSWLDFSCERLCWDGWTGSGAERRHDSAVRGGLNNKNERWIWFELLCERFTTEIHLECERRRAAEEVQDLPEKVRNCFEAPCDGPLDCMVGLDMWNPHLDMKWIKQTEKILYWTSQDGSVCFRLRWLYGSNLFLFIDTRAAFGKKKTLSELGFTRDPVFLQPWFFDTSPISRHGDVSYTRRQRRGRQLRKVAAVLRCQRQDLVDGEFWLQNQKTELNIITDHIVNKLWVMLVPPGNLTTQGRGR